LKLSATAEKIVVDPIPVVSESTEDSKLINPTVVFPDPIALELNLCLITLIS